MSEKSRRVNAEQQPQVNTRTPFLVLTASEKGESAIVMNAKETGSGNGLNCRLKLSNGMFFNCIFDKNVNTQGLNKGAEIVLFSFELVAINKPEFKDYIYFHITNDADFEIIKAVDNVAPKNNQPVRNNRRSQDQDIV